MELIQIDRDLGYAWLWKFLITWRDDEIFIGYYNDYEHCTYRWRI